MGAAREEASIKRLGLSPYVETFNSKVIKRFRTCTKKSLRVFEFRDSCVLRYVYMLPTFNVHFAHGHIRVYVYSTNGNGGVLQISKNRNLTIRCSLSLVLWHINPM